MIDGSPVVESKPTGYQYVMLAIEVTKLAFFDYRDAVCDLYCLRWPRKSEYALMRNEEVKSRARRKAKVPKASTDVARISAAIQEEKKHLKRVVRRLEMFFEDGICGLAFHFEGGNATYFKYLAMKFTENYVKKGDYNG